MSKNDASDRQEAADSTENTDATNSTDEAAPGRDPDEPMTDTQRTYLEPLAKSQDEEVRDEMTEAEAAGAIDRLQENAGHVH